MSDKWSHVFLAWRFYVIGYLLNFEIILHFCYIYEKGIEKKLNLL